MPPKLLFKDVKEEIESVEGYKLISEDYKDAVTKLDIQCPKEHIFKMTIHCFKKGKRCSVCFKSEKHTIEYIKNNIKSFGYTMVDDFYVNCMTKINIKCNKNHFYKATFNKFNLGRRCPICKIDNYKGTNNPRWKENRSNIKIRKEIRKYFNKNWIIKNMKDDPNYKEYLKNPNDFVVDHILPINAFCKLISEFNYDKEIIKEIANKRINLQLLDTHTNGIKSDRYNKDDLIKYINENYEKEKIC